MIHSTHSLPVLLILVLSLACTTRAEVAEDASKAIDGNWTASTAELGGQPFPDEVRKSIRLIVQNGKYTVTVGAQPDTGTLTLDPSKNPKSLDIHGTQGPNEGKTFLAIYEKTGDTLKVCYDLSGKSRPTRFATTKEDQFFLVTYDRAKP